MCESEGRPCSGEACVLLYSRGGEPAAYAWPSCGLEVLLPYMCLSGEGWRRKGWKSCLAADGGARLGEGGCMLFDGGAWAGGDGCDCEG